MTGKTRKEAGSSSDGGRDRGESMLVDYGKRKSSCGYCKSGGRTSISHGIWAFSLTVDDYQDLLDRGWRRSGCFLYKPDMEKTCCPAYTIRLKAGDYVPSKEQLRVSRRMQRFLDGAIDVKKPKQSNTSEEGVPQICGDGYSSTSAVREAVADEEKSREEQFIHYLSDKLDNVLGACTRSGEFPRNIQLPKASVRKVAEAKRKLLIQGSEDLLYSSNVAFQIAATLRRAQSAQKDVCPPSLSEYTAEEKGLCFECSPEIIAERVASSLSQLVEKPDLSVRACKGHINFYVAQQQAPSSKGLQIVSGPEGSPTRCRRKRSCLKKSPEHPKGNRQRLEIRLKKASFDPEEYALYRRYQLKVHNDAPNHVNEESYMRFLVDTPLVYVPSSGDGTVPFCGFGSFHQQYLIDGKLIAVGVIDILPNCLSSKYLFWDPDFAFLSLGKYSVIQEIGWVKENQSLCPSLQYYYLGYYIHSCRKMRYKAAYHPSELLCPLRYQWVRFDIAKPLLDVKPYVVLTDFSTSRNGESSPPHVPEDLKDQSHDELGHDELGQDEFNDMLVDDDEEMYDQDSESSDDEMGPESSSETEVDDVSDILIGLQQSHVRFKDLRQFLGPTQRSYFESRLRSYTRAVGADLSKRMVYLLPGDTLAK